MKEINIDGVIYVPKDQNKELAANFFIVRSDRAGVFAGEIESRNGREIVMKNARRLWRWSGASECLQLAMDGVSKPEGCKFSVVVPVVTVLDVIEFTPASAKAQKSIMEVAEWRS